MAYIIGLLTKEEEEALKARGWEIETPPKELEPDIPSDTSRLCMIWVDANMFDVMSGPDWDTKCSECENLVSGDLVSTRHKDSCSLNPNNLVPGAKNECKTTS